MKSEKNDSPIKPMGGFARFIIRLLMVALIVGAALAIAKGIVFLLGL